jgi:gamma-glutamyltranspeptidase / glutathione hydrolase
MPSMPLSPPAWRCGDIVHIDVIDANGNMVSATPSGGWLQSSPTIPALGFCLNSRAQMFWLTEGLASSLGPGRRPRTTLSPSMALKDGKPQLIFGTPGGDQQEQWQLPFLLCHLHHGLGLQDAIEAPAFHTSHFPASFYPRTSDPAGLTIERDIGEPTLAALRTRGHRLAVAEPQTVGRLTAASRDADGILRGAATTRLGQAYAVGR